jgi:hypothetical protein
MKTLKFALIAVLVACTMVSLANADDFKSKPRKSVHITFDKAIKNPGLVMSIYQQVDPKFLNSIEQLYVVKVEYMGVVYHILGSRQSWLSFFRPKPIPPGLKKGGGRIAVDL